MMQIQFWNHTNCFKRYYHFSKWVLQYVKNYTKFVFIKQLYLYVIVLRRDHMQHSLDQTFLC